MRGLVTPRYAWTHYLASTVHPFGPDIPYSGIHHELYDLLTDPHEIRNLLAPAFPGENALARLVTDPTHGAVIRDMRALAREMTDTADLYARVLSDVTHTVPAAARSGSRGRAISPRARSSSTAHRAATRARGSSRATSPSPSHTT